MHNLISLIKKLRAKTNASIMQCKAALIKNAYNFKLAEAFIKSENRAQTYKTNSLKMKHGFVITHIEQNKGTIIEINSDTDFMLHNKQLQNISTEIAKEAVKHESLETLQNTVITSTGMTVKETINYHSNITKENIQLRRMKTIEVKHGIISSYIHNYITDNIGTIGVLISIETNIINNNQNYSILQKFGKELAMHIAACNPIYIDRNQNNTKELSTQNKNLEQESLLDQIFILDNEHKISETIKNIEHKIQGNIKIKNFVRFKATEINRL